MLAHQILTASQHNTRMCCLVHTLTLQPFIYFYRAYFPVYLLELKVKDPIKNLYLHLKLGPSGFSSGRL